MTNKSCKSKTPLAEIQIRAYSPSAQVVIAEKEQLQGLEDLLDTERQQEYSSNGFALWPKEDLSHKWEEKENYSLCTLKPEDKTYELLEHFLYMSSDTVSYESQRGEFSRAMKAGDGFLGSLLEVLRLMEPPKHEGWIGSIRIHRIEVNRNTGLLAAYQKRKQVIEEELREKGITEPLAEISWTRKSPLGLPELDGKCGESFLIHGLEKVNNKGQEIVPLIFSDGFRTDNAHRGIGSGYGPLGQGAYFTDSFAKAATYTECPGCSRNPAGVLQKNAATRSPG